MCSSSDLGPKLLDRPRTRHGPQSTRPKLEKGRVSPKIQVAVKPTTRKAKSNHQFSTQLQRDGNSSFSILPCYELSTRVGWVGGRRFDQSIISSIHVQNRAAAAQPRPRAQRAPTRTNAPCLDAAAPAQEAQRERSIDRRQFDREAESDSLSLQPQPATIGHRQHRIESRSIDQERGREAPRVQAALAHD